MVLITAISRGISQFLCKRDVIAVEEIEIYQYGFEIVVSTILGTLIVLLIGAVLNMFFMAVLYYIIFVTLRQMTGGYHADTYFKCNLSFGILSFAVLGLTKLVAQNGLYSVNIHILILLFSVLVIAVYAPIENPNKPLDAQQIRRNRLLSIIFAGVLSAGSCALLKVNLTITILIGFTLFLVAMLILIVKMQRKEEY